MPLDRLKWLHVFIILFFSYLLLTTLSGVLGYLENPGHRIRGHDSVFYYSYLPSVIFDGDIDLENNLRNIYGSDYQKAKEKLHLKSTSTGLAENTFSIGPAILWLPFFLLAHLVTLAAQLFGSTLKANGYSYYYQLFVYVGNSLYGFTGVIFTVLFLKNFLRPASTLIACLAIIFTSQLTYYFWSFTALSHNVSFAMSALFFFLWFRKGIHITTALAAAVMILVRWQNALFLFPLIIFSLISFTSILKKRERMIIWLKQHVLFVFIIVAFFIPQSVVWWILYGSPLVVPQGSGFIDFSDLPLWQILFSTRHGLFTWHPLLLIGLLGISFLWQKNRVAVIGFFGVFFLQLVLNASIEDWWAGWSFGHRRFISLLPLFALGIGLIFERLSKKWFVAAGIIVFMFSLWNQLFIYQYRHSLIPRAEALSFREMVTDKFHLQSLRQTKKLSLSALKTLLLNQDIKKSWLLAEKAYNTNPNYRGTRPIYGFICIATNARMECIKVFKEWLVEEPDEILARWGLAELYIRQRDFNSAALLFPESPAGSSLESKIRTQIDQKRRTLINKDFTDRYLNYLRTADYF